ncbi:MAG: PaaI family thioesterase [Pseudomonadota bacterium]
MTDDNQARPPTTAAPVHEEGVLLRGFPHAEEIGMRTHGAPGGSALISLPYDDKLVGDIETGVIHGGVVTTLLDTGCGIAVITRTGGGGVATLDLRIDYMRPARPHRILWTRCECYRVTRSVAFARGLAFDGDDEDPVATAAGAFMLTPKTAGTPDPAAKTGGAP